MEKLSKLSKREEYAEKTCKMRRDGWNYYEIVKYWSVRAKKAEKIKNEIFELVN